MLMGGAFVVLMSGSFLESVEPTLGRHPRTSNSLRL
jgi:hypothetical protein